MLFLASKKDLRRRSTPDETSESETSSSSADGDEEGEENNSPPEAGRKKRAAPTSPDVEAPKRVKGSLADNSAWDIDSSPERPRRTKPRAAS